MRSKRPGVRGRGGDRDRGNRGRQSGPQRATRRRPSDPASGREPTQHPQRAAALRTRGDTPLRTALAGSWLGMRDAAGRFDGARLAAHDEWRALIPAIERVGADAAQVLPRLAEYIAQVLEWNRTTSNLVSRGDESRLVSRHLVESLAPLPWLMESEARRWIDLGSGAGFPALPLAIAGVGDQWLLVESRRPKALFLRRVTQALALSHVRIAHARLEELLHRESLGEHDPEAARAGGFPFDGFTSRATLTLGPTLALAAESVRVGGVAFLWKGSSRDAEMVSGASSIHRWQDDGEQVLDHGTIAIRKLLLMK